MTQRHKGSSEAVAIELIVSKTSEHAALTSADVAALRTLEPSIQRLREKRDIVRQGDRPDAAVLVMSGILARYHTLPGGDRQYLSFHLKGDMPDIQSLFLTTMDHSVCAINRTEIALLRHDQLLDIMKKHPTICFAFWRLTLADAAIFRQTITNVGARSAVARIAHFFCEQIVRAQRAGLTDENACTLALSQEELGQASGLSLVTVNRALQRLRAEAGVEFRAGHLRVREWVRLTEIGGFDPSYLYTTD